MEKTECYKYGRYVIYLISCLLNDIIPEKSIVESIDLKSLLLVAKNHSLIAITAYALERCGIYDVPFEEEKNKAIRKNILLHAELKKVCRCLEDNKVWYMPLKGAILKEYYPAVGMRQMSDIDILCDETKMDIVKNVMKKCGFEIISYGQSHQDVYRKLPVSTFEMHSRLFEPRHRSEWYEYYNKIKNKLVKVTDSDYEYCFSDEDFYIFIIAHEYKHYCGTGIGIRALLDTYLYLNKKKNLDWEYIYNELSVLGMKEFEEKNRILSKKIFEGTKLSDEEEKLLDYYIISGTHGIIENRISNSLKGDASFLSKFRYAFSRIAYSEETIRENHPFFYRHRSLRFLLYIHKLIKKLIFRPKAIFKEISELKKYR